MMKRLIDKPTYPLVTIATVALLALFLTVAGCAPATPWRPTPPQASMKPPASSHPVWDMWGNRYPELCRHHTYRTPVEIVHERMPDDDRGNWRIGAYWAPGVRGPKAVLGVDISISDRMTQQQILLHERCHHIMWELTGSADWHR